METPTTKLKLMSLIQRDLTTILLGCLAFCLPDIGAAQKLFSVDFESHADVKVYVVDYESRADLLVFREDYQSRASGNDGRWFFVDYRSQADNHLFRGFRV